VEPGSTPRPLVQKKTWRDFVPIDMILSAVSVLVLAQSSSEIPEELMNNPVYGTKLVEYCICMNFMVPPCINNIKHFIVQLMHTNYKILRKLK
jgi:hypothetical protein